MVKVMLVEDDITMLNLLGTLLQMEGFAVARIRQEETLDDLVATLHRETPDIVLLDIHLRQISGFDLLERIRQDGILKNLRVLMSSGMECAAECLEAGADGFILKPYMPDDLIRLIRKTIVKSTSS